MNANSIVWVVDSITKDRAKVISDKKMEAIYSTICKRVVNSLIINTDEHKTYFSLQKFGYIHDTVCLKYFFIKTVIGAHTQRVESFNNALKLNIKAQKGVKTNLRPSFLTFFAWKWNHKENLGVS
ncbi:hypothetical protein COBT_002595, partial [Conglomerata obtusa]